METTIDSDDDSDSDSIKFLKNLPPGILNDSSSDSFEESD
jgi:hypothetical protein